MASNRGIQIGSAWFQRKLNLRPQHRGVHLVTEEILKQVPELSQFAVGLCHIQSEYPLPWQHSSLAADAASLPPVIFTLHNIICRFNAYIVKWYKPGVVNSYQRDRRAVASWSMDVVSSNAHIGESRTQRELGPWCQRRYGNDAQ